MKEFTPYLVFDGNCREAMTFYQSCLGGNLHMLTFGEAQKGATADAKDRLIHARLANGSMILMASDNMPGMPYQQGNDTFNSLNCDSDEEVDKLHASMSSGGKTSMPPADAFWGAYFAMFTDRFGFNWMLSHGKPGQG